MRSSCLPLFFFLNYCENEAIWRRSLVPMWSAIFIQSLPWVRTASINLASSSTPQGPALNFYVYDGDCFSPLINLWDSSTAATVFVCNFCTRFFSGGGFSNDRLIFWTPLTGPAKLSLVWTYLPSSNWFSSSFRLSLTELIDSLIFSSIFLSAGSCSFSSLPPEPDAAELSNWSLFS